MKYKTRQKERKPDRDFLSKIRRKAKPLAK